MTKITEIIQIEGWCVPAAVREKLYEYTVKVDDGRTRMYATPKAGVSLDDIDKYRMVSAEKVTEAGVEGVER